MLNPGQTLFAHTFQIANAILGGASVFSRGFTSPVVLEPTRVIADVADTQTLYLHLSAHLRSLANVDLPGVIHIQTNDLWPPAVVNGAVGPTAVANPTRSDLGDWVTNGGVPPAGASVQGWQEWEDWSPLTVPTAPPGFSSGGNTGLRYEWRKYIGRLRSNFLWVSLTNAGSVDATEWGLGVWLSTDPGALEI